MSSFNEWGLSDSIIQAIAKMGFEEATPIQEQTIPITLLGRDIIGQAQTGTGKTVAYGIPLVEKVLLDNEKVQGIVVTPTRELAIQVAEELNRIGEFKGVRSLPIYGGQEIIHQIKALKHRPRIIVGTPGRLLDHLRRKTIRLQDIKLVILDEADEMLNMGFIDDIKAILSTVPAERQTLLFSATMPKAIRNLAEQFMINPESISVKRQDVTVPDTEQYYMEVPEREKYEVLCRLLDIQSPNLAIIFGRTKKRVDELSEALIARGYSAEGIHGDLTQSKRDSVIRHFREGTTEILVATDVAARGLDISGVTHVYNFDIPQGAESYVHRVGRTGRAGKAGQAITFITPREHGHLAVIEQVIKRKIIRQPMPTVIQAIEGKQRITVEKILGALGESSNKHYQRVAQDLLADNDAVTLLSAALRLLTKEPDRTPVKITEHAPLRTKKVHEDRKPWPPRRSKTEKDFARPQVKRKTDRDQ